MTADRRVSLYIGVTHVVAEVGRWCEEHALPHAHEATVYLLWHDGVSVGGVHRGCDER